MTAKPPLSECCDPVAPDWPTIELADTWADHIRLSRPSGLWRFLRALTGPRRPVQVDRQHPLFSHIPKYALQEFHNLPNGNYSKKISRGYITGFDRAMLGAMGAVRADMAARVSDCGSVLDVGTGGGKLAAAVQQAGPEDVWGVDVSPYLLKHAAEMHPSVRFLPAAAEDLPFGDNRFDAVVASFVFHEMPPRYARQALGEIARVLRPGGRLLVAEPSENQLQPVRPRALLGLGGWRHWYFKNLARRVHEPFVMAWHKLDKPAEFAAAGLELLEHRDHIPINFYSLKKHSACPETVIA